MTISTTSLNVNLIQPNNVTFARYKISEVQENILTAIIESLQGHMTNKIELNRDLFDQPIVIISCTGLAGKNNKVAVRKHAIDLMTKPFSFKWRNEKVHSGDIRTDGVIISNVHDFIGTDKLELTINPWALPFLIFYGKEVGGTYFRKNISDNLRGDYIKRVYKVICQWKKKKVYDYRISEFRNDFFVPASYTNATIKRDIILRAKTLIDQSESDVKFDFKFICKNKISGKRSKADTIRLFIYDSNHIPNNELNDIYVTVYRWTCIMYPDANKSMRVADKIVSEEYKSNGNTQKIFDKIIYYESLIVNGSKQKAEVSNILKKILRQDYDIQ